MLFTLFIHSAGANLAPPIDPTLQVCRAEFVCGSAEAGKSCTVTTIGDEPCPELASAGMRLGCIRNVPEPDGSITAVYCEEESPQLIPQEPTGTLQKARRCGAAGQALLLPFFWLGWRRRVVREMSAPHP